ncbi:MAG: hypothetical protein M9957_12060 [Rhodobacteraceae bacterium]|nr:hypothetical protein [Paracoccaceae bacterium]
MARRNRVTPEGAITADPARGLFTGNRGILYDAEGRMRWTHRHRAWISCVLCWKGDRQPLEDAHRWTPLFFLDEAVAMAAGHRPCATCRRTAYTRFRAAWTEAGLGGDPRAGDFDRALHRARILPRTGEKVTFATPWPALPDGAFVRLDAGPALVLGAQIRPWSAAGYGAPLPRPAKGAARVLTPAPLVAVLAAGYAPELHPTAGAMSHLR